MKKQYTWRLALPHCPPIVINADAWHWRRNGTQHGPQSSPRLVALSLVRLGNVVAPSSGFRLWVYFRGGYACHADCYIDRRARP